MKKLKSVTIENGVCKIGEGMFKGSAFRSVRIPASVTEIKKQAFYSYSPKDGKLQNVVIRVSKSKKREYTKALRKGGLPEYVKIVGE